jgi:hypothetical protein
MNVTELMAELDRLGIRIEARGDRLRYAPRSAMTENLAKLLAAHKCELMAVLRRDRTTICCPWCRRTALVDGERGAWCTNCDRLAWLEMPGGDFIRADHVDDQVLDPPDPCADCGGIERWQDAGGRLRCPSCDPVPGHGARLRGLAARIHAASNMFRTNR